VLAFVVLSLVWCAEVFSVISLRTHVAANFFPRAYCIYFCLFLLYFCHFPCGFCYLALWSTVLLAVHAMLYVLNTLEIPAVEAGVISAITPREGHNVLAELLGTRVGQQPGSQSQAPTAAAVASGNAAGASSAIDGDGSSRQAPGTEADAAYAVDAAYGLDTRTYSLDSLQGVDFESFVIGGGFELDDTDTGPPGGGCSNTTTRADANASSEGQRRHRAGSELRALRSAVGGGVAQSSGGDGNRSANISLSQRIEQRQMATFLASQSSANPNPSILSGDMRASPRSSASARVRVSHAAPFAGAQPAEDVTGWFTGIKRTLGISSPARSRGRSRASSTATATAARAAGAAAGEGEGEGALSAAAAASLEPPALVRTTSGDDYGHSGSLIYGDLK